jgi:hypothetical protein
LNALNGGGTGFELLRTFRKAINQKSTAEGAIFPLDNAPKRQTIKLPWKKKQQ